MSSTNHTTNYNLSQYIGSDKPSYLGDYNGDMLKIDTQMKVNADAIAATDATATTANSTATTALADAATAQTTANNANTSASNASSIATQALSKATANESAITSLEAKNVYSTTEQVIGTWIDGKPLYRRVFTTTLGTIVDGTYSNFEIYDAGLSVDIIDYMHVEGTLINGNTKQPMYYAANNGRVIKCFYGAGTHQGSIAIASNGSGFSNNQCIIIGEYTKKTDVAPNE